MEGINYYFRWNELLANVLCELKESIHFFKGKKKEYAQLVLDEYYEILLEDCYLYNNKAYIVIGADNNDANESDSQGSYWTLTIECNFTKETIKFIDYEQG